ncbi:MAG: DUF2175 domain-containing protein [Oscillospiraceae bacterium]|jgi:hypothetical protein
MRCIKKPQIMAESFKREMIAILNKSYPQKDETAKTPQNGSAPNEEELRKINQFTRRTFSADELYVFPVVLCDNEIDRDGERFSISALKTLAELFVGKTGIFNHSGRTEDQAARIFDCRVESDPEHRTSAGEPYTRLTASAYLPRTSKNEDLIAELESGIKKEVSVGCAVRRITCSICGADWKSGDCKHIRGQEYDGKICCAVLDEPTDAYEWSFVAVPSQREAGVIKHYSGASEMGTQDILKTLRAGEAVTLTRGEAEQLACRVEKLEQEAACGRAYRQELTKEFVRYAALSKPEIPTESLRRAADAMSLDDLKCFAAAFRRDAQRLVPLTPQLAGQQKENQRNSNFAFKI